MKVGVSTSISAESYDVALLAKRAEELGFESFFVPEHTIMPLNITTRYHGTSDGSIPEYMTYMVDPLITLARASAATEKIMLGTGVLLVPEHNPILLGKEVLHPGLPVGRQVHLRNRRWLDEGRSRDNGQRLRPSLGADPGVYPGDEGAMDQG